ncbi:CDP-glucose 4,6-dehydratase [Leptospira sp. 201903070]|uniref:CDP-glucose 4,6-dehydratase n=1 Tax=Leptospira ainlahdjerensis TaxID=2810033 RepID=A0ABS2UAU9_9LEPT|nr:CDP-glucose 4,6-dehydratase [Leptospira ainlahdjerensis]MBM9577299.1 CDP-glucose 4,6-dehydratase [Leptospira ainlahdjerensis]
MFLNVYKGKRVLITGHTGFKGSWLSAWLNLLGATVAGYSKDIPTVPSNFELMNLADHMGHFLGDIRDKSRLEKVIDDFKPEFIFHMAAQALVKRSYRDPVETFETNVMGMVNLLDIIRSKSFVKVAVLITSDKAYRNDEWPWGYRETDALAGHDPYSGSKSCADLVANSFYKSFFENSDQRIGITRAGNVIGGGDWAEDRIVPDCIRAWSKNEPVLIRSPLATRPWQHVLEPLSGYLDLGKRLYLNQDGLNGEAFNFGPDANVNETVLELLNKIKLIWPEVRWSIPEDHKEGGKEAKLLKLSCDKALFYLNWRPVLKIDETVSFTIDWYKNWLEKNADVGSFTNQQIDSYVGLAKERSIQWVQ